MAAAVVIVEPHASGHRAQYVRWICQALAAVGHHPVIATSEQMLGHPVIDLTVREGVAGAASIPLPVWTTVPARNRAALLLRDLRYWWLIRRLFRLASRNCRVTAAVLPYVDYCFLSLALLGSPFRNVPWVGITMRADMAGNGIRQWVRCMALRRIVRQPSLSRLFTNDPRNTDVEFSEAPGKFEYLADPVDLAPEGNRQRLRAQLGLVEGQHVLLVFGSLDERKGIAEVLTALDGVPADVSIVALLAGEQMPGIRDLLSAPLASRLERIGRLRLIPRRIEDGEVPDLLAAADSAWVAYSGHVHMSGVMVLAAVAGLPLVVTKTGAIAQVASRMTHTYAVDPSDAKEVAATLAKLANGPRHRRDKLECDQIRARHSLGEFRARIVGALECRLS